jgi:hypothetical protein
MSNKTIQISVTDWLGYLQWNNYWDSGNQVHVVIDGNKRQVYLIINYVMFVYFFVIALGTNHVHSHFT